MFTTEEMRRVIVALPRARADAVMEQLYSTKVCQIKDIETKAVPKALLSPEQEQVLKLSEQVSALIEQLEPYAAKEKKQVLRNLFSAKRPVVNEIQSTPQRIQQDVMRVDNAFRKNIQEIDTIEEQYGKNAYLVESLKKLPQRMTLDLIANKEKLYIRKITGIIAKQSIPTIKQKLAKSALMLTYPLDDTSTLIIITTTPEQEEETHQFLHHIGFEKLELPAAKAKPAEIIHKLKEENAALKAKEQKAQKYLYSIAATHLPIFKTHKTQLMKSKALSDAVLKQGGTESFRLLECWVPVQQLSSFKTALEKTPAYYAVHEEREDAPTKLKNPRIVKPFEQVTELYSLPKYKRIDPTPLLAITFSFFFGFMLTDAIYGLLLLVCGLLLLRGKGSYNQQVMNIGIILSVFGAFTLVLGIAFGSYFGNLFQMLGLRVPLIVDAMSQVMIVLAATLVIGSAHLLTGLIIGFVENVKKKQLFDAVHIQGVWIAFLIAIIFFIFGLRVEGYTFLTISVILQVVMTFIRTDVISAVLSIFNFPSFIGDLFSYGRLMALALGTAGIALAVNFMAVLAWGIPIIGPIAAIIIFVVGHVFNMAMNGLGAFVHSIRLHFLELFSRFYEGGGAKYVPFGEEKR